MSEFVEVLGKLKPKNFGNGAWFHVVDSGDVNFEFDNTAIYQPQSLVLYNGNWFVRNGTISGYNAGTLPTNTTFFKPLNPGRDLGHFDTLEDLETAYPSPNPGSIATYGTETIIVKWNADAGEYEEVKGGGGDGGREYWVNSDIDTVSAPNTHRGAKTLEAENIIMPPELDSITHLASLDGETYEALADEAALNTWVATNVSTDSTVWQHKISANFGSGKSGEVQVILIFS